MTRAKHTTGSPAASQRSWRLLTATRVFALAVVLGLATVTGHLPVVAPAFFTLCVLAAVMSIPAPGSALYAVAPTAEGVLVALVVTSLGAAGATLLPYLLVPAFVAGVQSGQMWAILTVLTQCFSQLAGGLAGTQDQPLSRLLERSAPWLLVGLGVGLLGAWMRHSDHPGAGEQERYEIAHRLLAQLRAVSPQLSSGLDTTTLAHQMLEGAADVLGAARASVLVRGNEGPLRGLATIRDSFDENLEDDPAVATCLQKRKPVVFRREPSDKLMAVRTVLPLRVASRVIGVLAADGPNAPDRSTRRRLQAHIDELSLRVESALLFDDLRSTATVEERHRLAREIHDGIAQEIASLGYLVDDLAADAASPAGKQMARQLRGELSRVVNELRLSIFDLRSNVSCHAGLGLVLSDYAREVGKQGGMTVHLAVSERPQRLHVLVESELLRIAQEAVTNARKHSRANNLWVTLNTESPVVMLRIEDDGVGAVKYRDNHYGLRMMQERAESIGGELAIRPRPRGGTSVIVTVWPSTNTTTGDQHEHLSLAR